MVDGARPTFEDAFRAEYAGIVRVVSPIVGSTADAEGVVQDAFVKAFARWPRLARYDRPGAWIQRVAIRDAVRLAQRTRPPEGIPTHGRDHADAVAVQIDLTQALPLLTPNQRACVVLRHLADWSTSEIASALGIREPTVRVHLHRARAVLSEVLRDEELTDGTG